MSLKLRFLDRFPVNPEQVKSENSLLKHIYQSFLSIPYENISKIVSRGLSQDDGYSDPSLLLNNFINFGNGGTCFSACYTLSFLLEEFGFENSIFLADRNFGENTHCFIIVKVNGFEYILDPAFFVVEIILKPKINSPYISERFSFVLDELGRIVCCSGKVTRFISKPSAASSEEFRKAWEKSFENPMLNKLCITKYDFESKNLYYLSHNVLKIFDSAKPVLSKKILITPEIIEEKFGISKEITSKAIAMLPEKRRCELL